MILEEQVKQLHTAADSIQRTLRKLPRFAVSVGDFENYTETIVRLYNVNLALQDATRFLDSLDPVQNV